MNVTTDASFLLSNLLSRQMKIRDRNNALLTFNTHVAIINTNKASRLQLKTNNANV